MPSSDDILSKNALSGIMGLPPTRPVDGGATNAAPAPSGIPAPLDAEPPTPTVDPAPRHRPTEGEGAQPVGHVGAGLIRTHKRGTVHRLHAAIDVDVFACLKRAAALGDDNGSSISEIVETALRQAGYFPGGPRDVATPTSPRR